MSVVIGKKVKGGTPKSAPKTKSTAASTKKRGK